MVIRPEDVLRLAPQVTIVEVEPGRALAVGAREPSLAIDGPVEIAVIHALATPRTTRDVLAQLESIAAPRVHHAMRRLVRFGVIVRSTSLRIAVGDGARWVADALSMRGVEVAADADTFVSLLSPLGLTKLVREARAARRAGQRWTFAATWADAVWLGPLLSRSGGPCVDCFAARLAHNLPVLELVERTEGEALVAGATDPSRLAIAVSLVAERIIGWDDGDQDTDAIVCLDTRTLSTTRHPLPRSAWCPSCASSSVDDADSQSMLERLSSLVDPVLGLVGRIEAPIGASGPFTCFAATPRRLPRGESPSAGGFVRISSGKGATREDARIGALAEAVERYSATFQGTEPVVRGTYEALCEEAIHPEALLGFSEQQYAQRAAWAERLEDPRRRVPPRLPADAEILWSRARSLVDDRSRLVPTAMVYLGHRDACTFCYDDPNGHAAGVDLEQAGLHALFELVERDAVAIWWYNRVRRPAVSIDDAVDPTVVEWAERFRRERWSVVVLDLTTDLGIPVYAAIARDDPEPTLGFGCHTDGRIALRRCLSELAQVRCARGVGRRRWTDEQRAAAVHFEPEGATCVVEAPFESVSVELVVERIAQRGHDVLLVDLSRPQTPLKTVRVIAPGLRHFWPRFGPGRLYDVPVALGWREAPISEAALYDAPLLW